MCAFCEHSDKLSSADEFLCELKGVVKADHVCRKFIYDPLKRIPAKTPDIKNVELVSIDDI